MAAFPNLAQWGNVGEYSNDPSTWGFTSGAGTISRSSAQSVSPLYSLRFGATDSGFAGGEYFFDTEIQQRALFEAGKKYVITASVRTSNAAPIADNAVQFTLVPDGGIPGEISHINQTVVSAKDAWVEIELRLTAQASGNHVFNIYLQRFDLGDDINLGNNLFVDNFFVREYVDTPPPVCTLEIDVPGTVIVDETGPATNDGSINIAITGGVGPFEYSNNNGASWQASPLFAGLGDGVYLCRVREQANPTCEDAQSFAVNEAGALFDFTTQVTHETIAGYNNGIIAVTLNPSVGGPFTYSKDGGLNYQGGNVFNNLAPGTYTIVVKDNAGNLVAKNATVNAGIVFFNKAYFSKNPIQYDVPAQAGYGALNNYRVYNDVRVEDVAGSSAFNSKMASELEPNAAGVAEFSIRQAFRGVLTAIAPTYNAAAITKLTDRIKVFKNYSGHLQDDEVVPGALSESLPFLVLLGGVDKLRYPTINFFTSYLPTYKKFMTWAPIEKEVTRYQEDYLNFWIYSIPITSITLRIKAYFDDDTTQTASIATQNGVIYGELYQIPAGPVNSGVLNINPAKTVTKYELWLEDQAAAVISEVRTYKISIIAHPLTRYFMFLNSLGAYEVHAFKGQAEINAQYQRDIIRKHLPNNYSASQGEFESNNATLRDEGSYSTGFFKGKYAAKWQEYMKDLMLSSRVYLLKGSTRKPVTILTNSFQWKVDQDYQHFLRFAAVDAYEDESFTPATV